AAKYANWIRDIVENLGFNPTRCVVVGSAKCGSIEDAYKVFKTMEEKNVLSYGSMIAWFAMHGFAYLALELFHTMVKIGIKTNRVTFTGGLTACVDYYSCMVDLLGRAGCLEEALNLAKTMPTKPNGGVWGALLGAFKTYLKLRAMKNSKSTSPIPLNFNIEKIDSSKKN
ncbi:hypothetical protein Gotri_027186, partial [Gossypium trilobum]|nr:hypothetical protein [Gossypium trilobum]